jgi:hypothetical protein
MTFSSSTGVYLNSIVSNIAIKKSFFKKTNSKINENTLFIISSSLTLTNSEFTDSNIDYSSDHVTTKGGFINVKS